MPKLSPPPFETETDTVHPVLGGGLGPYRYQLLSDPGGLTQFGAFIEELPPGSTSGRRHWHETEDEMVLILSGEVVLVEDEESILRAGDAACWPAGVSCTPRYGTCSIRPASASRLTMLVAEAGATPSAWAMAEFDASWPRLTSM